MNTIQKHTLTFAIDPCVIYFVKQGVDTRFNEEFLTSAVESGLTALVSMFTLLGVLVACECWSLCLSVCIAETELCITEPPPPHATPV